MVDDKGKKEQVKGGVKEKTGKLTGDKEKQTEGFLEKAKGKVKEAASDAKETAEGVKNAVKKDSDKEK
ncbi:CsbD family protein [Listeria newyorkensis]|uniref:CsbD family protein n=1 Tax=Listeria newyorkensis TaxID=1497681 RepID=A0ABX4XS18_9LIST|nr:MULTISPECIES: CsbD family protein [Listeria]KGL38605.1 hypothetical protein EP56_15685 [Listeriaceae bacterium FSL A5-0209]KGL46649.1 hypothetical protein EP58_01065 [Listeria newyorkensis]KMT59060.1 MF3-like protein [Listeria newyorkensis]PNP91011.1 CsbD family protein [Listeria newyorkensis]RQW67903.1 CsbD family protein [Listeria sp. SHR_NRA_18]